MIIITKNKAYRWDYKRLFKNLFNIALIIIFIVGFLAVSTMEFNSYIVK